MGVLWGKSGSLEFDNNGAVATGALARFYVGNTTTPLAVYEDAAETTPHTFPLEADGNGRWPDVFIPFTASYDVKVTTSGGTQLYYPQGIPNPAPFDESFTLDTTTILNTGDCFFSLVNGTRTGAVRLNGRSIGSASSGASERAHADTEDLFAYLWDNLSNTAAGVSGGRGATAAADFAADKRLTLPDLRSASAVGFADMGNTDNTLLTGIPTVLGNGTTSGSIVGANSHTLTLPQVPVHSHTINLTSGAGTAHSHSVSGNTADESAHTHTGTTGTESADHTHTYNTATTKTATATGFGTLTGSIWAGADTGATSGGRSAAHTHTFTSDAGSAHHHSISLTSGNESAHTHAVSGESNNTGGGESHNNVPRAGTVTWFIKL